MRRLGGLALTLLVLSCGSDDPPSGQASCQETSRLICDLVFDCAEGEPLRSTSGGTKDGCVQLFDEECLDSPTGCAPGATYNPDKGQACVAAVRTVSCADMAASTELNATLSPGPCNETCAAPAP